MNLLCLKREGLERINLRIFRWHLPIVRFVFLGELFSGTSGISGFTGTLFAVYGLNPLWLPDKPMAAVIKAIALPLLDAPFILICGYCSANVE